MMSSAIRLRKWNQASHVCQNQQISYGIQIHDWNRFPGGFNGVEFDSNLDRTCFGSGGRQNFSFFFSHNLSTVFLRHDHEEDNDEFEYELRPQMSQTSSYVTVW